MDLRSDKDIAREERMSSNLLPARSLKHRSTGELQSPITGLPLFTAFVFFFLILSTRAFVIFLRLVLKQTPPISDQLSYFLHHTPPGIVHTLGQLRVLGRS